MCLSPFLNIFQGFGTRLILRPRGSVGGVGWSMLTFLVSCTRCWCSAPAGMWGRTGVGWGMLTFLVRCRRCWCSATATMWGRGWGGVGHANVPCTLHTLLMFRNCQDVGHGVGWGMLTFLVRCTRCWCSATARMWGRGWGGVGHVNVPCTLHTLLMFRNCQDVGQGLGWGGAC